MRSGTMRFRRLIALILALLCWLTLTTTVLGSQRDEWRNKMMPITPQSYLCRFTSEPIHIDGQLDEAAWAAAPWTSDFVDVQGAAKPAPRFRTRAKLLWDE